MPKRVYISGAISGISNYRARFDKAERKLLSQGYKVINPSCMDDVLINATYEEYMEADIFLLGMCDSIYMLKGWDKYRGANREYGYALAKGMEIMFE